jgi:hypothetical protein
MNLPDDTLLNAMRAEGTALGEALLDRDLTEVRFRAHRLQAMAGRLGFGPALTAAVRLVECLGPESTVPAPGYSDALFALSDAIECLSRSPR